MCDPSKIVIFFQDYHHDGGDKVVEATLNEWERMIEPATKNGFPIDAGTIDEDLFEELYSRDAVVLPRDFCIDRIVPLV